MNKPVVVVSGLPRSGTSLLMQMLTAGGLEPLTDGQRIADEDNPHGYLELEAVKGLKQGAPWIAEARGKVVKVISHLLADLPADEQYLVVFVERDLDEVLASQAKMMARLGKAAPPQDPVRRAFTAHLQAFDRLAAGRPGMTVLRLPYADVVARPDEAAQRLAEFVGAVAENPLDRAAMAAVVDPTLYRNRAPA